jgi:hypothetical protein
MTNKKKYENKAKRFGWTKHIEVTGSVVRFYYLNKKKKKFRPICNILAKETIELQNKSKED